MLGSRILIPFFFLICSVRIYELVLHYEEPHPCTLLLAALVQKYVIVPPPKKNPKPLNKHKNKHTKKNHYTNRARANLTKQMLAMACCRLRAGSQPAFFVLHEDLSMTPSTGCRGIRAQARAATSGQQERASYLQECWGSNARLGTPSLYLQKHLIGYVAKNCYCFYMMFWDVLYQGW